MKLLPTRGIISQKNIQMKTLILRDITIMSIHPGSKGFIQTARVLIIMITTIPTPQITVMKVMDAATASIPEADVIPPHAMADTPAYRFLWASVLAGVDMDLAGAILIMDTDGAILIIAMAGVILIMDMAGVTEAATGTGTGTDTMLVEVVIITILTITIHITAHGSTGAAHLMVAEEHTGLRGIPVTRI